MIIESKYELCDVRSNELISFIVVRTSVPIKERSEKERIGTST